MTDFNYKYNSDKNKINYTVEYFEGLRCLKSPAESK